MMAVLKRPGFPRVPQKSYRALARLPAVSLIDMIDFPLFQLFSPLLFRLIKPCCNCVSIESSRFIYIFLLKAELLFFMTDV